MSDASAKPRNTPPLILTLRLDQARQLRFDALRQEHFPPERNYLSAHVTLFHHLPGEEVLEIIERLRAIMDGRPPPSVTVDSVASLGRGVAFRLTSPDTLEIRRALATEWRPRLTSQDLNFGGLHVTVQNKVAPAVAQDLLARLRSGFAPHDFLAPGLDLWRYLGGPWEHVHAFDFSAE
ncbi:2'-5' RNA ligase family protein [Methylopila sp. 73B]|uniref:2'-5' RNA ligase family protein n=1 Tax=Methylopila sp. 73B TaxID=1120792 RepID=UPI000376EB25|nr:2'-5' RNA ligase family protein [Methylopila sp. 73B]